MDPRLLRFFVAVYEEKSLTRAAQVCFVSQPNMSNGIKQLEKKLGTILFERKKKGVGLTEEAHYLYPVARRLIGDLNHLPEMFHDETPRQKVSMGVADGLPQDLKQDFFRKATKEVENLEWDLRPMGRECEINLLVREYKYQEHLFLPLWTEDYVLCIPNGHPLLKKDVVELADLKDEPFIHCPACESHIQTLTVLNGSASKWNTVANCESKNEVLTMVMAGVGITFLPETFARSGTGFKIKPFNGPRYYREVGLAYPKESLKNPAVEKIVEVFSRPENKY